MSQVVSISGDIVNYLVTLAGLNLTYLGDSPQSIDENANKKLLYVDTNTIDSKVNLVGLKYPSTFPDKFTGVNVISTVPISKLYGENIMLQLELQPDTLAKLLVSFGFVNFKGSFIEAYNLIHWYLFYKHQDKLSYGERNYISSLGLAELEQRYKLGISYIEYLWVLSTGTLAPIVTINDGATKLWNAPSYIHIAGYYSECLYDVYGQAVDPIYLGTDYMAESTRLLGASFPSKGYAPDIISVLTLGIVHYVDGNIPKLLDHFQALVDGNFRNVRDVLHIGSNSMYNDWNIVYDDMVRGYIDVFSQNPIKPEGLTNDEIREDLATLPGWQLLGLTEQEAFDQAVELPDISAYDRSELIVVYKNNFQQ